MPALFRTFAGLAVLCSLVLGAKAAPRPEHVFIVSIDGGKPAALAQSDMPVLKDLAAKGACTWSATTIFPCQTLPSHTSMLTGVEPAKHNIYWNTWKPRKGVVRVTTLFRESKRAGLSTAMFVGKEKFRHLAQPGTVDKFSYDAKSHNAAQVGRDAAAYILEQKPNLCFIHFGDGDSTGHKYGWGSREQLKAFGEIDTALGIVLKSINDAGIAGQSVLIVTADHGGHSRTHGRREPQDMEIPWVVWGQGVKEGFTITAPVNTCDTAATALWLLDVPVPASFDGRPVTSTFQN